MSEKGAQLGSAYVQIVPSAQGISGSISGMLGGEATAAGKSAGGLLGNSIVSTLTGIIAAAGIGKFISDSIATGMDFDKAMSQVAATMGTTVDQIGELRDFAKEMGATTAFSANQAAEALNFMALAGYDAETSMQMLPNVLNLAAAGGMELATASDMVTDAQTALGLSLEETSTMVDQMAKASSKSNTSVAQLGDAFLTIGANARQARGGTAELSTVLGVLADNGIKGSEAGTHLRNIMLAMNPTTDKAAAAWKELGVSAYDAEGNLRALPEVFEDLNKAMEGMTEQQKTDMFSAMFNKTDLASIQALVGTTSERFAELNTEIKGAWYTSESLDEKLKSIGLSMSDAESNLSQLGITSKEFQRALNSSEGEAGALVSSLLNMAEQGTSTGDVVNALGGDMLALQTAMDGVTSAAQAMADTQLDNLDGDITLMKSALEGVQTAISEKVMPGLRDMVQSGSGLLSSLTNAIGAGNWSAVGAILRNGLSQALDMAFQGITTGLDFLSNNMDGIISQGMAFITVFADSIAQNAPTIIPAAMDAVLSFIESSLDNADGMMSAGESVLRGLFDGIVAAGGIFMERAPEIIMKLGEAILSSSQQLLSTGTAILQPMLDGITASLPGLLSTGVEIITNLANGILEAIPTLIETAGELIIQFADFLLTNLPTMVDAGIQLVVNLSTGIFTAMPKLVEVAQKLMLEAAATLIKHLPEIYAVGVTLPAKLALGIIQAIPQLVPAAMKMGTQIVTTVKNFDWIGLGKDIINGIINGVKMMGDTFITSVVSMCQGALQAVKNFFGIKSPSKVMANEVGRYIPEGIAVGISKYSGAVNDAMEELKADALSTVAVMDVNTSPEFSSNGNSQESILARMDAMLSLMERYYPEMSENSGTVSISAINRQLGAAYS